jgi:maltose alpha-D-glucosyltransferase / alpha-amylase
MELAERDLSIASAAVGPFLASAQLLGKRTAELHLALASDVDDPNFAPELFTPFSQRSFYQSLRGLNQRVFATLVRRLPNLPPAHKAEAQQIRNWEEKIHAVFTGVRSEAIRATQIRCHNDYHLGQVLFTGSDFVIIDFEGEPARSLGERRLKRSPLRDVAGMIRSFHYAAYAELGEDPDPASERRAVEWYRASAAAFLQSYLELTKGASFIPADRKQTEKLLNIFLLEKAVYELGYELNNRPGWVHIPIRGIKGLMPDENNPGKS